MASASDYVVLRGYTVPLAPWRLVLDLQERGLSFERDGDDIVVRPKALLTDQDREALRRWKRHVLVLLDYEPPEVQ